MSKRADTPVLTPVIPGSKIIEIVFTRQAFDVTPLPEQYPDPDWSWTDSAGTRHAWVITGEDEEGYPEGEEPETLSWVVDSEATDEYPEEGHYESVFTGERVVPGVKCKSMFERYDIGPLSFRIDLELAWEVPEAIAELGELDLSEVISGASGRCRAVTLETYYGIGLHRAKLESVGEFEIPGYTLPKGKP